MTWGWTGPCPLSLAVGLLVCFGAALVLPASNLAQDFDVDVEPTRQRAPAATTEDITLPVDNAPDATIIAISLSPLIEVHDVASRGIRVRVLLEEAQEPTGVVILFAGGRGAKRISDQGVVRQLAGNFLVRSRHLFLGQGLTTVTFDAPSDVRDDLRTFHTTASFAKDVGAVIQHLRELYDLPVWLVGTSRGTVPVANAAARLEEAGPDGIVFTATLFNGSDRPTVYGTRLMNIRGPVLVVHHKSDRCNLTPARSIGRFEKKLEAATLFKVLLCEGGRASGDVCGARHFHGFNGIERQVVGDIARFIQAPSP